MCCFIFGDGPGDSDVMVELNSVSGEDKLERVLEVAGDQTTGVELGGEEEGGWREGERGRKRE